MQEATKRVWEIIANHYKTTGYKGSSIVIPFDIREKRIEIAKELVYNGLINNYDYYGKDKLQYTLSEKAQLLLDTEKK